MSSSGGDQTLDGFSGFILATFTVVSIFVNWPLYLPLPLILQRYFLNFLQTLRIVGPADFKALSKQRMHVPLSLSTAPVLGVILLLATTTINGETISLGIKGDNNIKPYDVLVLFISLAYISIALDGTGGIEAVAFWVAQRGGKSARRLFLILYLFFVTAGSIIGNDPLILSGTPFLAYLTSYAKLEPTPWVFSEFMAANTASAVLVSSNPTNVLITGTFSLNYLTGFTKWTVLPSLVPAVLTYLWLFFTFKKGIPKTITPLMDNPWSKLKKPTKAILLSVLMLTTIATLVGTNFVPNGKVQVWMVTAPAGLLALTIEIVADLFDASTQKSIIKEKEGGGATELQVVEELMSNGSKQPTPNPVSTQSSDQPANRQIDARTVIEHNQIKEPASIMSLLRLITRRLPGTMNTVRRLPISLLPFAMCEFIMVRGLDQRGWIRVFAQGFSKACTSPARAVFFMGYVTAAFLCPLAGTNIGATIILVEIMQDPAFSQSLAIKSDPRILLGAIYGVALGSNIGAFSFTFAGSLAGLLWRTLLIEKGINIGRRQFAVTNFIPLLLQITTACAIILGQLYWFA